MIVCFHNNLVNNISNHFILRKIVVTYEKIINNLSDNLMSFELESKSRKYNGYTLFSKHYHLLYKEDVVDVDFLCSGMEQLLLLADCDSDSDEFSIEED